MDIYLPHNYETRDYQKPLWEAMKGGRKRAVAVWHRRAGKDLFAINWIAYSAFQRRGLYWHCFPTYAQGRKVAWEGFTKEGKKFRDAFPKEIIHAESDKEMKVEFRPDGAGEGSIYQVVGTDAIDRLVGANPIGVVFSEYSLSDPSAWHLIQPILRENGGWAMFIYTPRGHNHGWDLLQKSRNSDRWFSEVLTVEDSVHEGKPVVDPVTIEEDREDGMPEELVQQEYFCSFDAPLVGAYYAKEMSRARQEARICEVPYEPGLPVSTYWDLGMDDATSIVFVQELPTQVRIIDYYENSGEGLAHYAKVLGDKPYVYGRHVGPHDLEVRELGTGKSRKETAYKLGIKFQVAKKMDLEDGIEATRNVLNRCWFDVKKCDRLVEALSSYQKIYNEEKKIFGSSPLHNWASHGADAFRTFAIAKKELKRKEEKGIAYSGMKEYTPKEFE